MKLLLDMNLSPAWVRFLEENGFEAVHWSTIGEPTATDAVIMAWARNRGFVVITYDLDFSALLAATEAVGRSATRPCRDAATVLAKRGSCAATGRGRGRPRAAGPAAPGAAGPGGGAA